MKNLIWFALLGVLFITQFPAAAQSENERLDLPGDNLNLYAVLRLFRSSPSLESFEAALNNKNSEVNNLDLNGDGYVDYMRIFDNISGKLHTITLKTAVSENEEQDIAAIFVEKKDDGKVLLQMIGDEELYGKDYIIEPQSSVRPTKKSDELDYLSTSSQTAIDNAGSKVVAEWPIVKYIFAPSYNGWRSSSRTNLYPPGWNAWRVHYWHYYNAYHYHLKNYYNQHFRRWTYLRSPWWHAHYTGANFRPRSAAVRAKKARGDYKATYSQPSSAAQGSLAFRKKNPNSPNASVTTPAFDSSGKPVTEKKPTTKPAAVKKKAAIKKKKKTTSSPGTRSSQSPATKSRQGTGNPS